MSMVFSEQAQALLRKYYMLPHEKTPQEAFYRAAYAYCYGDTGLASRITYYALKGWFMFASPVLSNAPEGEWVMHSGYYTDDDYWEFKPKGKIKGLPISCFVTYVPDSLEGLIEHTTEVRWLSVKGGGVGGYWGHVRAVSDIAPGPIPFIHTVDADMTAYRQGTTRKGAYAAYMDVSHPDILEFLQIRTPTGGDINRKAFNIHIAVNIPHAFMEAAIKGEKWDLKDPHTGEVRDTVDARGLLQQIIETRARTGEPYLNFIDTINEAMPEPLKQAGLKIHSSNLCNEIHLPTDEKRTAVCCLSSVNLEKYDEWKDTRMVRDLVRFLDNVLQFFIDHARKLPGFEKAVHSAETERSIGLGAMGWHGYLQKHRIPWESAVAVAANRRIFEHIKQEAEAASRKLAQERGEPELLKGTGRRNAHLLAIAPNANSGIILGTSPSIEPYKSNAYVQRTRAGTHLIKNPHLQALLAEKELDTEAIWQSIILNKGSVQHLEELTDYEKDVFKTAIELDQRWVVEHAATRQPYICQGQSVNLFFPADAHKAYVLKCHLDAWEKGLKGLYYYRTEAARQAEAVGTKVERKALKDFEACLSCQG